MKITKCNAGCTTTDLTLYWRVVVSRVIVIISMHDDVCCAVSLLLLNAIIDGVLKRYRYIT